MSVTYDSPTEYIGHHLTFLTHRLDAGGFWTLNVDTMLASAVIGVLAFGFMWLVTRKATSGVPSKTQAFVELSVDFVNNEVKSIYTGSNKLIAPIALTTFVLTLFMNAMDFLPIDIVSGGLHAIGFQKFRYVPTADVNTTFALAFAVFGISIFFAIKAKGLGGWVRELFCAPFGASPFLWPFNLLFNCVEYVSKTLSHSLRLFGNMYAGELIFLLLGLLGATGIAGVIFGAVLHLGWSIFELLIVILQAYIFMMLAAVYIAMAYEHH
ncbi:MAG TPA: F0F1 ATP synthase subunit A [Casimicrobiaceae bacterium]|nr:F0F1 ATP synthase subunit A [Casimicrobiaceae bacterium]